MRCLEVIKGELAFIVYPKQGNHKAEVTARIFRYVTEAIDEERLTFQQHYTMSPTSSQDSAAAIEAAVHLEELQSNTMALLVLDG